MHWHWCFVSDWTTSTQSFCRTFVLMNHSFKICAGAPKWTSACKLQNLKFCFYPCSRSRNWGFLRNGKICHHFTKHVRRISPPTLHYKNIHVQYNSLRHFQRYNQSTSLTRNGYTVFLDLWSKKAKNFLISWKEGQENVADYFIKHHSAKHRKRARLIYPQTNKTLR